MSRRIKRDGTVQEVSIKWPNDRFPEREDWIRLAAFIDGEGCIRAQVGGKAVSPRKTPRYSIFLMVANTDPRLPEWCSRVFGGGVYSHTYSNPRNRADYRWQVSCRRAKAILAGCMPFLLIKKEQGEVAMALAATFVDPHPDYKRLGVPPELVARRKELACKLRDLKKITTFPPLEEEGEGTGRVM